MLDGPTEILLRRLREGLPAAPFLLLGAVPADPVWRALITATIPRASTAVAIMADVKRWLSTGRSAPPLFAPQSGRRPPDSGRGPFAFERLAASIDEAMDAEMRRELEGLRGASEVRSDTPAPPLELAGESTKEAPRQTLERVWSTDLAHPAGQGEARWAGRLEEADLPVLLGRAFTEATTGRLRCRRGGVERAIFFEAGRPVLATSTAPEDRLIELFLRRGRVTPAQHDEAVRAAAATGRRMGALLIDLGIMKSNELLPAVREHYEEIIFALFSWEAGDWQLDPGVVADPKRLRLLRHPAALVRGGLERAYDLTRMRRRVGPGQKVLALARGEGALELLGELGLQGVEGRVPALFDGQRSVDAVIRAAGGHEAEVLRVALALSSFGLLLPGGGGPARREAGALAGRARDRRIERERILARLALVKEADYFQLFGIDRAADAAEVRRAYERLVDELSDETVGVELAEGLRREIEVIRSAVAEGLRLLACDALRARYRSALAARPLRGTVTAADVTR
jgi:hypothetical protein